MRRLPLLLPLLAATLALNACQGNVFDLAVGTCFDEPGTGEITDVPIVECDEPHDYEVFATFELPEGEFPGDDALDDQGAEGCFDRFEPWTGIAYEESALDIRWLAPTREGWDDADDREVVCSVVDFNGDKLTGSMEGAGV